MLSVDGIAMVRAMQFVSKVNCVAVVVPSTGSEEDVVRSCAHSRML
jgi:hypothetical protein